MCVLFVYFPFEYTARLSLAQLGKNLQTCGLYRGETHTVVTVLAHGVGAVVGYFLPLVLGILVVERPRLWGAEVAVVVVEVEPINLHIAHLVGLVELIGDGLGSALLEPPVVVGF